MNLVERHIKKVLRDKYRLRVGHVKTGPHSGRYKICRFNSDSERNYVDRIIASDIGLSFVEYRAYLLQGMSFNYDYWVDEESIVKGNIHFASKMLCMAALYNLYKGLERRQEDEPNQHSPEPPIGY